jgi:flagella basal body P-ring formation protein FlgA
MAAGEIISQSDLTVRDLAGSSGGIDSPAQVIGRSLRRAISAGEAPLSNDLEEVATVVRAVADLRAGDMIPATVLRTELLPRSKIPLGAVTRVDELNRARLRRDVPADRVLVSDDLIDTRPVVVARRNMMRGETIDSTSLEVIEMDRRALPADHLSSAQGLAILADEKKAQKVANYAEDLYDRNPTSSRRRVDCHGAVAHHRWAQNEADDNEYFELLRILKNRQMREAKAKILDAIVSGKPCVLKKSVKPKKTRGQDFTCSCVWDPPVRAAQDASTATSSGRM